MKIDPNACIHDYDMVNLTISDNFVYVACKKCNKNTKHVNALAFNQSLQNHQDQILKSSDFNVRREFWKQSALAFITTGVTTLGSDGLSSSAANVADKLLKQYDTRIRHGDI